MSALSDQTADTTKPARKVPLESDQKVIEQYLDTLWLEKGLSDNTLASYRRDLSLYGCWLNERGTLLLAGVRTDLLAYLNWRMRQRMKPTSTSRMLSCLRGFYRYWLREEKIPEDPTLQ